MGAEASYENSRVAILSMPLECSVSYGRGTARGPAAILEASAQVELYDEQLGFEPYRTGIWTTDPIDAEHGGQLNSLERYRKAIRKLFDDDKWVVTLGGEHSLTPVAVEEVASRHKGLTVVQLDAHADLRESYHSNPHSHACAMFRCLPFAEVRALGVRSYCQEEADRIAAGIPGYRVVHGWEIDAAGERAASLLEGLAGRPVYLTIDLDYFDPCIMPAVGTPEPGGGQWWPTLTFLQRLFTESEVVAADVVELAPLPGLPMAEFTAARLVHKLIGFRFPQLR
jgi:agmatinase